MAMAFFLGANSCEGFMSLYPQLQKEAPRRLYVIKGGPGCGKATCIRALTEALGGAEEVFHCSADPDSLDGAVAADRVILDGTAPHVFEPTFPGCMVPARVLGYLEMTDGGMTDYKLISVVDCDPRYDDIQELSDLPSFMLKEIANFFANYKVLQNVPVEVGDYHTKAEAIRIIAECREKFKKHS